MSYINKILEKKHCLKDEISIFNDAVYKWISDHGFFPDFPPEYQIICFARTFTAFVDGTFGKETRCRNLKSECNTVFRLTGITYDTKNDEYLVCGQTLYEFHPYLKTSYTTPDPDTEAVFWPGHLLPGELTRITQQILSLPSNITPE